MNNRIIKEQEAFIYSIIFVIIEKVIPCISYLIYYSADLL